MNQSRPHTILFADVCGSSRLFESRGEVEARRLIASVLEALGAVSAQYGGRVVKTTGDELMCALPSAMNGLLAACEMQRTIANDVNFARDRLAVHIGLHHDDASEEGGGEHSDAVNIAARMASLAKREQIVTTAITVHGVSGRPETRSLGRARVSGKLLPMEIVDVVWREDGLGMSPVGIDEGPAVTAGDRLILRHRGRLIELNENSGPFLMGRELGNHLVVEVDWVSRSHARIEYRLGRFMIQDHSSNGSYVRIGQERELRVHRQETQLRRSGSISLGRADVIGTQNLIHFEAD